MTISYLLGFPPKWLVFDNLGVPAAGGKLFTYSSLNPSVTKAAYSDAAGSNPYPVFPIGIVFDANGTKGPIYFKSDSTSLNDNYYLRMEDANGNLLWDQTIYTGAGGGGGGGVITNDVDIANFITNGVFWRTNQPIRLTAGSPAQTFATSTSVILAPGAHDSLVGGANVGGPTDPDVIFAKNNTNATDTLEFIPFLLGANNLTPDITPQYYLEYSCSAVNAGGETYKYVQWPITAKVQNLSNTAVSAVIYARCTAGNPTMQLYLRQFYGDGPSASAEQRSALGVAIVLTNTWTKYNVTGIVPNATGKIIGECHNDGLYFQVGLPLSAVSTIDMVKPAIYTGSFNPQIEFLTMDQIDAVTMTPRVGDIKTALSSVAPPGYLAMNDGSIGSYTSGATTRANVDAFALYSLLWNAVSNTYAPVSTGRGASAVADFATNKTLTMPLSLGRALAGSGSGVGLTPRVLGQSLGVETIAVAQMPSHTHTLLNIPLMGQADSTVNPVQHTRVGYGLAGAADQPLPPPAMSISSTGNGAADGNMPPTSYFNVFIKF